MIVSELDIKDMSINELLDMFQTMDNVLEAVRIYYS